MGQHKNVVNQQDVEQREQYDGQLTMDHLILNKSLHMHMYITWTDKHLNTWNINLLYRLCLFA